MRPAQENQGSFLGRISIRRNQIVDVNNEQELEDLELFQKHVADRFSDLLSPPASATDEANTAAEQIMSVSWLRKLLDVFLCCEAEFKAILLMGRDPTHISKPPMDRLVPEMLDRSVKALDICTAVVNGIDSVRHYQRLAEIAVAALEQRPLGDGNVRKAKRALANLVVALSLEDKDISGGGGGSKATERSWSFGRRGGGGSANKGGGEAAVGQFRSSSWAVGRNWSAAKQIHAMSTNLVAPRGAEASGLPQPVYIMSTITLFVMWALVAAVPCQERNGLVSHPPVSKQLAWAHSLIGLHEKIGDEWKKKEKRGSAGLMEEMTKMEKLGQTLMEFTDGFQLPADAEKEEEMAAPVAEMAEICGRMEEELVPLQQQIREVFHRIVRSRAEILDALGQSGRVSAPVM